jgi:hypothetical protein
MRRQGMIARLIEECGFLGGGTGNQQFKFSEMSAWISAHESCTLIKLLWQPLHCRNSWVEL